MPKVIHVLRKFEPGQWGGTETHVLGLIPELERFGWVSEVHAPREAGTDGAPVVAVGARFRTFRAHYPYLKMSRADRAALVASAGNLVTIDELVRLMADRRASLLHVHTQNRLGGVVRLASRLRGVPYAVSIHGPVRVGGTAVPTAADRRLVDLGAPFGLAVGARRVVHDADLVFTVSDQEMAAWRDDRAGRHLECIPHGVTTARASTAERARARASVPGLGSAPFALVVGRIDRVKGQDLAVAAFREVAPPELHLVLVGAVTDEDFARTVAGAAGADARVHLAGGVAPSVARALMAEAHLALIPSRAEAFGIVLLEAWAEGTPALFSDVGGLADLSRRAGVGFGRVAEVTPDAWATALSGALADRASLDAERSAGPARVAHGYSWRSVAERVARAYRQACEARA